MTFGDGTCQTTADGLLAGMAADPHAAWEKLSAVILNGELTEATGCMVKDIDYAWVDPLVLLLLFAACLNG